MHYLILSFTHKNTTLSIRDKLAFNSEEEKRVLLERSKDSPFINETVVLSTCNRIEIMASCNNLHEASRHFFLLLNAHSGLAMDELEGRADIFEDQSAVHHLFSVASSLDSLVVGETQIAGQLKDAYRFSLEQGFCADKLTRAITYAFKCAAEIRNSTDISSKPVSIASVAVAKARSEFGSLEGRSALVIGSGEMSVIAARTLVNHGASVTMMNRTRSKIEEVAAEIDADIVELSDLSDVLEHFDMIFTATGSARPIIGKNVGLKNERQRHWFDMAVPRDIDDIEQPYVSVHRVDDLKQTVDENLMLREEEAKSSFAIVGRYTVEFYAWLKTLNMEPLIKELYRRAETAAAEETERVLQKGFVPPEYAEAARKMCLQALKRYLHPQTEQLRRVSEIGDTDAMIASLNFMLNRKEE